jgi:hypothetical protein
VLVTVLEDAPEADTRDVSETALLSEEALSGLTAIGEYFDRTSPQYTSVWVSPDLVAGESSCHGHSL